MTDENKSAFAVVPTNFTYIYTYVCICMYACVYIYGIFILKIISKYLPVG